MTQSKSLWGDIPTPENLPTLPKVILREQGAFLTKATSGILIGEVIQKEQSGQAFSATLRIKVPALNDYMFNILNIEYPIHLYPVKLWDMTTGKKVDCDTHERYTQKLEEILNSQKVKTVISTLLAQVLGDKEGVNEENSKIV